MKAKTPLRLAEDLIAAAERLAQVRASNAAYVARNGMMGQKRIAKEDAAEERYFAACEALRAALKPSQVG